jgi:hypothetical protein
MQFLSDVYIRCPDCNGQRYRPEVLEVKLPSSANDRDKSIAEVLDLTVTEAMEFFANYREVIQGIEPLQRKKIPPFYFYSMNPPPAYTLMILPPCSKSSAACWQKVTP